MIPDANQQKRHKKWRWSTYGSALALLALVTVPVVVFYHNYYKKRGCTIFPTTITLNGTAQGGVLSLTELLPIEGSICVGRNDSRGILSSGLKTAGR